VEQIDQGFHLFFVGVAAALTLYLLSALLFAALG
jgi:hypothetical protein